MLIMQKKYIKYVLRNVALVLITREVAYMTVITSKEVIVDSAAKGVSLHRPRVYFSQLIRLQRRRGREVNKPDLKKGHSFCTRAAFLSGSIYRAQVAKNFPRDMSIC